MIDKEILKQSFQKAYNKGWARNPTNYYYGMLNHIEGISTTKDWVSRQLCMAEIFSHDFAKAFWGEKEQYYSHPLNENSECDLIEDWKYNLMVMVLEKEPLKYLEKFLKASED